MKSATEYASVAVAHVPPALGALWAPLQWWYAPIGFRQDARTDGSPVPVVANHGRWVVECPDCRDAQFACKTDPRFMCVNCGNAANAGAFRPVLWPEDVAACELALESRPVSLQNTDAGQQLADLIEENEILASGAVLP